MIPYPSLSDWYGTIPIPKGLGSFHSCERVSVYRLIIFLVQIVGKRLRFKSKQVDGILNPSNYTFTTCRTYGTTPPVFTPRVKSPIGKKIYFLLSET